MEKSHSPTPMVVLTSERASSPRLSGVYFFSFVCGTGCIVYTTIAAFSLPRPGWTGGMPFFLQRSRVLHSENGVLAACMAAGPIKREVPGASGIGSSVVCG